MKINEIILEGPLPDDWDAKVYDKRNTFKNRVAYAKQRARQLGTGSSRIAFEIPYQGRPTVLKIAKNAKGMAQNQEEADLFSDWYLQNTGFVIPLVDHHEDDDPTWIHTEFAEKMTPKKFQSFFGVDQYTLNSYVQAIRKHDHRRADAILASYNIDLDENELFSDYATLFGSEYTHVNIADLNGIRNWGIYDGRPVIIDLGFSDSVAKLYGF